MTPAPRRQHPPSIHATAVLIGEAGVLIRGASGAGKTQLGRALLAAALARGQFALLIGDDRVLLVARAGRLLASPVQAIAGLVEIRGLGLAPEPHAPTGIIRLVVDLVDEEPPRLPEPDDLVAVAAGVTLPRLQLLARAGGGLGAQVMDVQAALRLFDA